MRIEFTHPFEDIPEREIRITRKEVISAVTNPLREQRLIFDGLEILLFVQRLSADSYIIVMGQKKNNTLEVGSSCFKVLSTLVKEANSDEPLILLQQLAISFGMPIRVGGNVGKFFFREDVPIPKDFKVLDLTEILAPKNFQGKIISSMYVMFKGGFAKCAIIFSIELNSYLNWLKGKEQMQPSPIVYDVFISYKRKTAEDFAIHLKECLTEEGYRAFLDLRDIPKEFLSTSKALDVRDEAIKNSRRFLLIMTVGIESSEEVAKELLLAREIQNMKFMYLRHEDLQHRLSIIYRGKTIELGEGNQEKFSTKEDLARKVLSILKSSTNPSGDK